MRGMATAIALHSALGDNDVWFRRVVSLVSQQDGVRATRTQSSIAPEQSRQPERPAMGEWVSIPTPAAPVTATVLRLGEMTSRREWDASSEIAWSLFTRTQHWPKMIAWRGKWRRSTAADVDRFIAAWRH